MGIWLSTLPPSVGSAGGGAVCPRRRRPGRLGLLCRITPAACPALQVPFSQPGPSPGSALMDRHDGSSLLEQGARLRLGEVRLPAPACFRELPRACLSSLRLMTETVCFADPSGEIPCSFCWSCCPGRVAREVVHDRLRRLLLSCGPSAARALRRPRPLMFLE